MAKVFLSLGSNVDPGYWIPQSLDRLRHTFGGLSISTIYRNKAAGFSGDDFHNLAVGLDTDLKINDLSGCLKTIEQECGRRRSSDRFSSRTLDIDILIYDDLVYRSDGFEIPRDELLEAAYILKPLAEIAPNFVHPMTGRTFKEHWEAFDQKAHRLIPV